MAALWVMNLDAEEELESPIGYNATARTRAAVDALLPRARALLAPGDVVLTEDGRRSGAGRAGEAWCPTPSALRRLVRAGATPPRAPPLSVLQRANHRRFGFDLGIPLTGAQFCATGREALDRLEQERGSGSFIVKRPFGFAGRGQRRIAGEPSDDDRRWLLSRRSAGGMLVEPEARIVRELSLHGYLSVSGALRSGRVCVQECDDRRVWRRSRVVTDLAPRHEQALRDVAALVAHALRQIGYFGPFGIDAYEHLEAGRLTLNPLGEINARYTMGYPVGMSGLEPRAEREESSV